MMPLPLWCRQAKLEMPRHCTFSECRKTNMLFSSPKQTTIYKKNVALCLKASAGAWCGTFPPFTSLPNAAASDTPDCCSCQVMDR